jgi:hypothetical protein
MTSPETRPATGGEASNQPRVRSVPHPRYNLAQVEDLAIGARHCDQDAVAQAVKYKNSTNGAFKGIRAAASYFGLITYRDDRYLSVTEPWIDAFHTGEEETIRRLRQEAVQQPELYQQLIEEFADRQLPNEEKLGRQLYLAPKYGILKDAGETAARVFLESVKFAGLVDSNNFLRIAGIGSDAVPSGVTSHPQPQEPSRQTAGSQTPPNVALTLTTMLPQGEGLDRIEVQLAGGRRAYLLVPVPLAPREKERLKKYIDLILEPDEPDGRID